jgi:hypothetical protein
MPPLPKLRRRDVVPHCNDVNVRVGRRYIIFAKMSRMRRRVRTGFRCAATCRELAPPLRLDIQPCSLFHFLIYLVETGSVSMFPESYIPGFIVPRVLYSPDTEGVICSLGPIFPSSYTLSTLESSPVKINAWSHYAVWLADL